MFRSSNSKGDHLSTSLKGDMYLNAFKDTEGRRGKQIHRHKEGGWNLVFVFQLCFYMRHTFFSILWTKDLVDLTFSCDTK